MRGFLNPDLNYDLKRGIYELIIDSLSKCSDLMKKDCLSNGVFISNHEEKIRNHLLEGYLDNSIIREVIGLSNIAIRFIPETLENYDFKTNTYVGRADIRVVSSNWLLGNNEDYYIVECKRINGERSLNSKYITEGIERFVVYPPKYPSYHNKNIMFGFVVKKIDIMSNVSEIAKLHQSRLDNIIEKNFDLIKKNEMNGFYLYNSKYDIQGKRLELQHIFYDFSSIIKT